MLRVVGRREQQENGDINGEYYLMGEHDQKAVYTMPSTGMSIRYYSRFGRWVIDRRGIQDSDICVAYADETQWMDHPACGQPLIWKVWESSQGMHVDDLQVLVIDAPNSLTFLGRPEHTAHFEIAGAHHGRALYRNQTRLIRYDGQECRWMLSQAHQLSGSECFAWADGGSSQHPGDPALLWNFWDNRQNAHIPDPNSKVMDVPLKLHMLGRSPESDNAALNGTYTLQGLAANRPVYVQNETNRLIRYCADSDRWLVECNHQASAGVMKQLANWIFQGGSSLQDCEAFCEAHGSAHPGLSELEWNVFDARAGRHVKDFEVRVFDVPLAITVCGRDARRDAAMEINGDYFLACTNAGLPAYQKNASDIFISYLPTHRRWTLGKGLCNPGSVFAYADKPPGQDHPSGLGIVWHVFEGARGEFLADPAIAVLSLASAPKMPASSLAPCTAQFGGA